MLQLATVVPMPAALGDQTRDIRLQQQHPRQRARQAPNAIGCYPPDRFNAYKRSFAKRRPVGVAASPPPAVSR